ncbi:MAG TPA: 50S ribosomal protein L33 [bacterium]|nr:50S ribosomal protein L33 [bacterium]
MRQEMTMVCSECKSKNYYTSKNKQNTSVKVELKKYCKKCRKHTTHKEAK